MIWVNHCHVLPSKHRELHVPPDGTLQDWLRVSPTLGIEKSVAFAPFSHQAFDDPNEWLAGCLKRYPSLIGCATIHPLSENAADRLKYFVEEHGFQAAKLHPPVMRFRVNDPAADPYYAMAERLEIPITFHTGVHGWRLRDYEPMLFDDVADRFPELKILLAHTGGTAQFNQALAVLQNRPNVYAELAQTRRILRGYCWHLSDENINLLLKSVGPSRIIYGCDWPWVTAPEIAKDIARIRSWDITESEKALILGGNLRRLISPRYQDADITVRSVAQPAASVSKILT